MKTDAPDGAVPRGAEDTLAPPFRFWMTRCMAVVMSACMGAGAARAVERSPSRSQLSPFGMAETVQRIEASALRHGMQVFALVDGSSRRVTPRADRAQVLVLASSDGGTLVTMDRAGGLPDVPLSLVFRDHLGGGTEIYINVEATSRRLHGLPPQVQRALAELPSLVAEALV